jgi:hypothetical protein
MVDAKGVNTLQIANMTGKIELQEDSVILNEEFKKNVAIPYFKDIYRDLVTQSDNKNKGINRITILSVSLFAHSLKSGAIRERLIHC